MYYHGPHKVWTIAGWPQITIDFILKFYLNLSTGERASYDILSWVIETSGLLFKNLFIMELRSDATLYSKLGNKNSDAGHIKSSRWSHLVRGPQVPHPWCTPSKSAKCGIHFFELCDASNALTVSRSIYQEKTGEGP